MVQRYYLASRREPLTALRFFFCSLTISAECPMQLEDFPMDAHACPLKFGSCKLFSQVRAMDILLGSISPYSEYGAQCDSLFRKTTESFVLTWLVSLSVKWERERLINRRHGLDKLSGDPEHWGVWSFDCGPPGPQLTELVFVHFSNCRCFTLRGAPHLQCILLCFYLCFVDPFLLECSIRTAVLFVRFTATAQHEHLAL